MIVGKVVDVVGVKRAIKLYYDTRNKENNGGVLVQVNPSYCIRTIELKLEIDTVIYFFQNGKRRRTPGGVFLSLLRETSYITSEEAERVFDEIKKYELRTAAVQYYPAWNF